MAKRKAKKFEITFQVEMYADAFDVDSDADSLESQAEDIVSDIWDDGTYSAKAKVHDSYTFMAEYVGDVEVDSK